jgi:predicted transcriptional regulator
MAEEKDTTLIELAAGIVESYVAIDHRPLEVRQIVPTASHGYPPFHG